MNNPFDEEFSKKSEINLGDIFSNLGNNFTKSTKKTRKKITIVLTILFILVYYYFLLPPLNLKSRETWFFVGIIFGILTFFGGKSLKFYKFYKKTLIIIIAAYFLLTIPGLKIFRAKEYANIINMTESKFKNDIEELPLNKIPTLDRKSSEKLGARKMGELLDLVSQFDIDTTYTQINYKKNPVRVTPLKYNGFIKYIFNSNEGIPGYIKIDIVNGNTELVKLDKKIKYSKGDYFFRNIKRYARLMYPTEIFEDINFEINDDGEPYWVIPTYQPKIYMFDALDVNGAILINASTGEHKKYELKDIPKWVDRVFNSDKIIEQLNWNGKLSGGYINSIFAQKNVLKTTDGYNYLALKDDVYLYTGFTSVASDESNVGFILSNQRTKETKFYPISSAEEFSAMSSAEGAVQEKKYNATFPLLLNIKGQPTYFLSLKDNAGLIKLYAFIDAKNYQNVSVGETVEKAYAKHTLGISNIEDKNYNILTTKGVISDIKEVVIKGNTHYYFTLENGKEVYVANISLSEKLPFLSIEKGKNIEVEFEYTKNNINEVVKFINLEVK